MGPRIAITVWRRPLPTFVGARTWLYTLAEEYVASVADTGAVPLLLPHLDPGQADRALDGVEGLLIAGGGDVDPASYGEPCRGSTGTDPAADASEIALARVARARGVPTLGICRGMQIVNVAFGGTLHQDIGVPGTLHEPISDDPDVVLAARHPVRIDGGSALASVFGAGERSVNTIHHQAIDRLAAGFAVTARAPDGVIEGVEADDGWDYLGVQWHPEKLHGADAALFAWLAEVAASGSDRTTGWRSPAGAGRGALATAAGALATASGAPGAAGGAPGAAGGAPPAGRGAPEGLPPVRSTGSAHPYGVKA